MANYRPIDNGVDSRKIFYGWWVVVSCLISMAMAGGIGNLSFPVVLKPLSVEFQWTRAQVSGGISIFMLAVALAAPFVGRVVTLHGPRAVMIPAAFFIGLCLILLAGTTKLWHLYALRFGIGLGFTSLAHVPVNIVISRWFVEKRGQAMGVAMIGAPIGGLIMTPVISVLVETVGWRQGFIALGIVVWVILVPLLWVLMRNDPTELGLRPDGHPVEELRTGDRSSGNAISGLSAKEALRSTTFWALVFIYLTAYTCIFSVMIHQFPYLTDEGYLPNQAAFLVSSLLSLSVVSGLTVGWMSDRWDPILLAAACYGSGAAGMVALLWGPSELAVIGYVVGFGVLFGGTTPLTALVTGRAFGSRAHGVIYGFFQTVICLSGFIGPTLMGYIHDTTGTYHVGFIGVVAGLFFAALLMLVFRATRLNTSPPTARTLRRS